MCEAVGGLEGSCLCVRVGGYTYVFIGVCISEGNGVCVIVSVGGFVCLFVCVGLCACVSAELTVFVVKRKCIETSRERALSQTISSHHTHFEGNPVQNITCDDN